MTPRWLDYARQHPTLTQGVGVALLVGLNTLLARGFLLSEDAVRSWGTAFAFGLCLASVSVVPSLLSLDCRQRGIAFRVGLVVATMLGYVAGLFSFLVDEQGQDWKMVVGAALFAALAAAVFAWSYRARERPERPGRTIVEVSPLHERMRTQRGG